MGWEMGCKGLTVYVTGSRQEVVLETKNVKDIKEGKTASTVAAPAVPEAVSKEITVSATDALDPFQIHRGYKLLGTTYKVTHHKAKLL